MVHGVMSVFTSGTVWDRRRVYQIQSSYGVECISEHCLLIELGRDI